ncbi:MAG: hypothetical protein HeimC2_15640 [Candidatus Heimdallarchaeota archaeon LC_2]|nr:MAG: hypothetical protein HeimC2_15640 [Candidatus Heimdallarchaeota archaeon LC_2]
METRGEIPTNFAPEVLNDPQTLIGTGVPVNNSIYAFNFVNTNRERTEVNFDSPPFLINSTDSNLILWFSIAGQKLPNGLFGNIGDRRPGQFVPYKFVIPTIYKTATIQENRFERIIREMDEVHSFDHSILDNNYCLFDADLDGFPYFHERNATLDLSINIHSGILQKLRYTNLLLTSTNHWETVAISIELSPPVTSNITFGGSSIPQFLLVFTPILIIAIILMYKRINRK